MVPACILSMVTEKSVGGAQVLATQKPVSRPGWWKGKFALFQMPATGVGEGWQTSVQKVGDSPHPLMATSGARAFIDRSRGLHTETAQSALTVIFKLVIGSLSSSILIV